MYLGKLLVQGFKSFASATELCFDPGITAIVGPNGCGKSNIVDALRWVIGEQRARVLRSDRMDNIIFNGTSKRRAVGLAEVQLTIMNTRGILPLEYSEVMLGRRLYRSGEAEYLLNGVPCRLRDITDLFTDTGMGAGAYSVIELKMIEEILSESTQDRRRLFEEASGITRYKKRRADALRKLDNMKSDLARVRDLKDEISSRVRSLKRQATIAERYLRYKSELNCAQLTLLQFEYSWLAFEEEDLAEDETRIADHCMDLTSKLHAYDAQLEALRTRFVSEQQSAEANRQELVRHEQRVAELEGEIRLGQANLKMIARDLDRLLLEGETAASESAELSDDRESVSSALSAAMPQAAKAVQDLDGAISARDTARENLGLREQERNSFQGTANDLSQQRAGIQRLVDRLQGRITHLRIEEDRLSTEQESGGETDAGAAKAVEAANHALEEAKQHLDAARSERTETETANEALARRITHAEDAVRLAEKGLAAKLGETKILRDLVDAYEFFPDAVRYLSARTENIEVTALGDLITCEPKYRAALAGALGAYGACMVAKTRADAEEAAELLRLGDMGRAYFIVLENVQDRPLVNESPPNALRTLVRLREEDCAPIVDLLLQDVFLVESLEEARVMLNNGRGANDRYVTLQGEWIDARGMVYAGGDEEGGVYSYLVQRGNLQEASDACSELEEQVEQAKNLLTEIRATQRQLNLKEVVDRAHIAEAKYAEANRTAQNCTQIHEIASNRLGELRHRKSQVEQEILDLESEVQSHGDELQESDEKLAEIQKHLKLVDDKIETSTTQLEAAQNTHIAAQAAAVKTASECDRLKGDMKRLEQHRMRLDKRVAQQGRDHAALIQAQKKVGAQVHELTLKLDDERARRKDLDNLSAQDKAREHESRVELEQVNDRLRKGRRALQEAKQEEADVRVKRSAVTARLEDMVHRASEEYGTKLTRISENTEIDEVALREEIKQKERKLQSMGNVNALALEEYEKENERLEFIETQFSDLEEAQSTLIRTIREINRTASKQFIDTFVLIRENFRELFCELFGEKAKCELDLTVPEDVLESPIAVTARPSGKRPVSIAQLSSGEKTLTAIALLFAIYLVKPSPFCFLDEVDAPLDDVNVEHFMRLIRRFSSDTQFVLVTHNKRTMEMADRLYGVTMQEEGVSSLVSVRFEEAMAMAG
ncbi:MAG: chromosome segregation protein SMC [Rhodothermaceae bacterium]|nr:chromosome segregation protein SMC [Rhodothermaceae bacterium]